MKGIIKDFNRFLSNKRKYRKNRPTAECGRRSDDKNHGKGSGFFASVFTDKIDLQIDLQESQAPENIVEDWSKDLPSC